MVHDDAGSLWLCLVIAFGDSFAVSFLLRGETRREKICGVDLVQIVLFPTQSAIERVLSKVARGFFIGFSSKCYLFESYFEDSATF